MGHDLAVHGPALWAGRDAGRDESRVGATETYNANELVQREREVAKLIWGVIEGLGGDRPKNWEDE